MLDDEEVEVNVDEGVDVIDDEIEVLVELDELQLLTEVDDEVDEIVVNIIDELDVNE